jgi:hypothetical protein
VPTSAWLVAGATVAEVSKALGPKEQDPNLPADMSTASLVGGGLIAGDALAALGLGLVGLATTLL